MQLLREDAIFGRVSWDDLEAIAAVMEHCTFAEGSILPSQNERGGILYVLVSGRVKTVIPSSAGKELVLAYLDAPALLGDAGCSENVAQSRGSADIIAISNVEALALQARDLLQVVSIQPEVAVEIIQAMSSRIHQLTASLEEMAFCDAAHRVKRVLLNIATASYEACGLPVVEGFTHSEIAALAGTSRETASRVISSLARDGLLATRGRKIVIDLLGLHEALEGVSHRADAE